jgi:glycine oxidase
VVVVIGAGLIGLSIAYELAKRGADVRVIDAHEPAGAASWAGAGMLAPYTEALDCAAFEAFCVRSLGLYPSFVEELREESGVDAHLRLDGIVEAAYSEADVARLRASVAALGARKVPAAWLSRGEARGLEPALGPHLHGAAFVEGQGQVDNRRLGRALRAACERRGVRIVAQAGGLAVEADPRRILGIRTAQGFVAAETVVNAAGAWAGEVEGVPACARIPVRPVKGQMLALALPRGLVQRVVWVPQAYLVPRIDGRLLVGATVEESGFDVRVTAAGLNALLNGALAAMPALRDLAVSESWAGLRPGTPDGLPFLGATALQGYLVASGHYRNGILLAPASAVAIADAVEGKPPLHGAEAFSPLRSKEPFPEVAK